MQKKTSKYMAKLPDENGIVDYTDEENETWAFLYDRQMQLIQGRACDEYTYGLEKLALPADRIPQLPEVNRVLRNATGWEVAAVPALIPFGEFFALLADKKFPAATFIRRKEEIDYLQEPDIFHEIYGHCPLFTDPVFADFSHNYGKLGLKASKEERVMLARVYWLTVEFGLIDTPRGLRIYGAGILSSKGETEYALDSDTPERRPFDV
ncbi:MAG: phenylalanine 4-monooxygenase, partial [Gammaproteobacteria bacterium]|nr:phenylalanine 4-monooxygenase [Gammaproteobacteria bacterium]